MNQLLTSEKIYVSKSLIPDSGRGVFARQDIKKGETIERCPTIEIPLNDVANLTDSIIITYIYYLGDNKDRALLALGFGPIYNHTYTPNADYQEKQNAEIIEFIATKDIAKDEEITVNYNSDNPNENSPLWFE